MVHIRKVEIFGFKSFGFKNTVVNFDPGLVSISGPNGSGKSNILDAIIFALGENKPTMLRVDKLRNLIHDVEGGRNGPKIARTSVQFDNNDRKIPIDSNLVTITREMDSKGDNIYYLNQKKTQRNHILELLEVANSAVHQLNAVQQGTVTRISEFSSEEKRQTIEDLIGLSYFDEKKAESLKQLDEADRTLEIAFARMDEVKKRIDELEVERNIKMKYDFIEKELNRFNAVVSSNKIRVMKGEKDSKEKDLNAIESDSKKLEEERDKLRKDIKELEDQKVKFMKEIDAYNTEKAELEAKLSDEMQQFDEATSAIATHTRRIEQIDSRQPEIDSDLESFNEESSSLQLKVDQLKEIIKSINDKKPIANEEVASIDSERSNALREQSEIASNKTKVDREISDLSTQLNNVKLSLSDNHMESNHITKKIKANSEKSTSLLVEAEKLNSLIQKLGPIKQNHEETIKKINSRLFMRNEVRERIENDIDDTSIIFEKASKAAAQFEAKIKLVKQIMHEDYSIAKLKDYSAKLGIEGLVYEMLSWDKKYERPILASGSDWIKALVVNDLTTLVSLSEFARQNNLPKLRIIPLDTISNFDLTTPKDQGVIGLLSDYVRCGKRLEPLKHFIFGNILLVDSNETARKLSLSGYRTVTMDGQFFEAKSNAVIIDINSKIANLTKIISTSTSIDGLNQSLQLLKKFIQKKKSKLRKTGEISRSLLSNLHASKTELTNTEISHSECKAKIASISYTRDQLSLRNSQLEKDKEKLATESAKQQSYVSSLEERISITKTNYAEEKQDNIASSLSAITERKLVLEKKLSEITAEYSERASELTTLSNEENSLKSQIRTLNDEKSVLNQEKIDLELELKQLNKQKEDAEVQLVPLREKEQEFISAGGASVSTIEEFDDKLKAVNEHERSLTTGINSSVRKTDSLSRDINDLQENESKLKKLLASYGYNETIESFDADAILKSLTAEKETLGRGLNAIAPEKFVEVADGYRLSSKRKNELEKERNSIVKFIEGVEEDKRQTFLEAYHKVDKEIGEAFNIITGGKAWLELQNEEDIFASGISYLLQWPKKPQRESASISGGEKTLAAIVFVLALQKLKPSTFYLFDEIDAHLDAPNSEKLSKIIAQRSHGSQFIMVSLKDTMLQKAQLIYGVYPKNGVSQVVTYKDKRMPTITN